MPLKLFDAKALKEIILGTGILKFEILSTASVIKCVWDTLNIKSKVPSLSTDDDILQALLALQKEGKITLTSEGWKIKK